MKPAILLSRVVENESIISSHENRLFNKQDRIDQYGSENPDRIDQYGPVTPISRVFCMKLQ